MTKVYKKIIQFIFFAGILLLLLTAPFLTLTYAKKGLSIWYQSMVPSLLPMMILTSCMIKLNITTTFASFLHPVTKRIYHLSKNGTYALLMGFLCGFPMGAKVITELYKNKKLSKDEANSLLPICNNIGPIFMLTYGLRTFVSKNSYVILFLFYGIPLVYAYFILRKKSFVSCTMKNNERMPFSVALDESISEGAAGILSLGGYLMFFSILSILPKEFLKLSNQVSSLCACLLEITDGLSYATDLPSYVLLSLLQFGGICCIFQTIKYLANTDLSLRHYLIHKFFLSVITLVFFFVFDVFFSSAFFAL